METAHTWLLLHQHRGMALVGCCVVLNLSLGLLLDLSHNGPIPDSGLKPTATSMSHLCICAVKRWDRAMRAVLLIAATGSARMPLAFVTRH